MHYFLGHSEFVKHPWIHLLPIGHVKWFGIWKQPRRYEYTLSEKEVIQTSYFVLFICLLVFTVHWSLCSLYSKMKHFADEFSWTSGISFQNIFVLFFVFQLNRSWDIPNNFRSTKQMDRKQCAISAKL